MSKTTFSSFLICQCKFAYTKKKDLCIDTSLGSTTLHVCTVLYCMCLCGLHLGTLAPFRSPKTCILFSCMITYAWHMQENYYFLLLFTVVQFTSEFSHVNLSHFVDSRLLL